MPASGNDEPHHFPLNFTIFSTCSFVLDGLRRFLARSPILDENRHPPKQTITLRQLFSTLDDNDRGCRFLKQNCSNRGQPESAVSALAGAFLCTKRYKKTRPRKPCQRVSLGVFLYEKSDKNAQATALTNSTNKKKPCQRGSLGIFF